MPHRPYAPIIEVLASFRLREGKVLGSRDPAMRARHREFLRRKRLCLQCSKPLTDDETNLCAKHKRDAVVRLARFEQRNPGRDRSPKIRNKAKDRAAKLRRYMQSKVNERCVKDGCKRAAHGDSLMCRKHAEVARAVSRESFRRRFAAKDLGWARRLARNIAAAVFIHVMNGIEAPTLARRVDCSRATIQPHTQRP